MDDLKAIIQQEGIEMSGDSFGGDLDPMCCSCEDGGKDACSPGCYTCNTTTY